jgi:hypothetical protein
LLRENTRWADLYRAVVPGEDPPVKWGEGEPADFPPFPSARDPNHRTDDPAAVFDYLVPGRVMVLTFRPQRYESDLKTELQLKDLLTEARERFQDQITWALDAAEWLQQQRASGGPAPGQSAGSSSGLKSSN